MVKATEIAVLTVNGEDFDDWESVMVRDAFGEMPPRRYRFTCSEGMPLVKNFAKLRIKPGDECTVKLAGELAITGKVYSRQVLYDKTSHTVQIEGGTYIDNIAKSSVISKTMEWKDVTAEQVIRSWLKPFGIPFKVEGGSLPDFKFPRISISHGTSVWDAIEQVGRDLGGVRFAGSPQDELVAIVGPKTGSGDYVIEGVNILIGREIILNRGMQGNSPQTAEGGDSTPRDAGVVSQQTGNNDKWGAAIASVPFLSTQMASIGKSFSSFVIPLENPTADQDHLKGRGGTERAFLNSDEITVFATVQGWLRPSGGLWERNQKVHCTSPMLIMDDDLISKSVTFTQDNTNGTRTVIELVNQNAMGGGSPQTK